MNVTALWGQGYSLREIAEELGVSRTTAFRRVKEAGLHRRPVPCREDAWHWVEVDRDLFEEMYYNNESVSAIGRKFGISRNTVRRRIQHWGLPKRNKYEARSSAARERAKKTQKRNAKGHFMSTEEYPEDYEYRDKSSVIKRAKEIRGDACELCGWDKATVDGHHIIEQKNGGKHVLDNIKLVCPNCHRLAHLGLVKL